jgi:hypothetical protein
MADGATRGFSSWTGAETSPPDLTDYFGPCVGNEVSVIRLKRFLQSPLELPMKCPQHVTFRVMLTRRRIGLVQAREPLEEDERFVISQLEVHGICHLPTTIP